MHFLHRSPKSILYYFLLIWLPLALVAALVVALLANSQIKASTVIAGAGQRAQVERAVSLLQSSIDNIRGDALYLANHVEFQHSEAFGLTQSDQRARSFADFLRFHAKYEQIRFIDTQGQEQVRVERQTDGLVITPKELLQDKSNRYYFQIGMQQPQRSVYFSPFDLNVENEQIQQPLNPTIRVATPIFDKQHNHKTGLLVINYRGAEILESLAEMDNKDGAQLWLVNQNGYWLKGPSPEHEWGFMLPARSAHSLPVEHIKLWSKIINAPEHGELTINDDHYSFTPVELSNATIKESEQTLGKLYLVSYLAGEQVKQAVAPLKKRFWAAGAVVVFILAVLAFLLSRSMVQRSQAEAELQASEAKFRAMIEAAPDAIIITDDAGTIVLINDQAIKLFEYAKHELLGEKVETLLPATLRNKHQKHRQLYAEAPKARLMGVGLDLKALRKDKSEFPVEISLSPIQTDSGKLTFCAIRDVTERRELTRKIEKLNQGLASRNNDLQLVNKELEAFSYSVSHDLRAPLRAIDGFSNILLSSLSEKLDEQEANYFNRIRAAANKMSTLIDDLLMLARVTQADVSLTEVNLSEVAEKVVQNLREAEPERNVQVYVQKNLWVDADPVLLQVTIENLISNAWKFTAKVGEAHINIERETRDGGEVVVIRDNGAGFDMGYADKLFTPFQRLHSASDFPGTGIGLATIARIMAKLNGRVWAEAEPGKGASFYLKFNSVRNTL